MGKNGLRSYLVLFVVGTGTLLSAMAGSAITLALPSIGSDLGIPIDQASWVIMSFLLVVTVLLLIAGRVGDMIGHRRVYLSGYFIFAFSSLACGLSSNVWILILARIFQGIGGSMVMATSPALLTTTFPGKQRGKALGMLATATYTGLTIGPPLGGFLIASLSWRWVFYINLPISLLVFTLGLFYLPKTAGSRKSQFDLKGSVSLIFGLPFILLAISKGQHWGWISFPTISSIIVGASLLCLFIHIERTQKEPLLNLGLFRSVVFTGAVLSALCNYIALFIQIILLPFYLLEAIRIEPSEAGIVLAAQPLVMAMVASPSGWLSDRIGSRGLAISGMLILAVGLFGMSTIGVATSSLTVALWLAVMGLGTGIFISPNSSALMGAAPKKQQGISGGVMAVSRNLGMMTGVMLATVIFQAMGGRTGGTWHATDINALRMALIFAAGISLLGALASALRGKESSSGL